MLVEQIQKMEQELVDKRARLTEYAGFESEVRELHSRLAMAVFASERLVRLFDKQEQTTTEEALPLRKSLPVPEDRILALQREIAPKLPSDSKIGGPEMRVLNAIAWFTSIGVEEPEQTAVAFLAGYSINSSSYGVPRSRLNAAGLVEYRGDQIKLTAAGRKAAHWPTSALTNGQLHRAIFDKIGGPEKRLLEPLIQAWPRDMSADDLAKKSGYSLTSSSFGVPRSRLKSFGLIEYSAAGRIRARDLLFPQAVR